MKTLTIWTAQREYGVSPARLAELEQDLEKEYRVLKRNQKLKTVKRSEELKRLVENAANH